MFGGIEKAKYPHMPLSDAAIRGAKPKEKSYKLSDANGLYLLIQPNGSKLWRLKYRFQGKEKLLSLGSYPAVGLAAAREKRAAARHRLDQGGDPAVRSHRSAWGVPTHMTFRHVAGEWFEQKKGGIVSGYAARIWARLEADIFPFRYEDPNAPEIDYPPLGEMAVDQIEAPILLAAIRPIEARGAIELAKRVKNNCGEIFRYAIADGKAKRDPSSDLRGALLKKKAVKGRTALKEQDLPEFLTRLGKYDGAEQTRLAVLLVLLTAVRTDEIRFAHRSEFEGLETSAPLWRIPAARMKRARDHLVPLSPQAAVIASRLLEIGGAGPLLLPSDTRSGVISENTMLYALYRMGYHHRATIHGLRKTFSTIANESGLFNEDWIEMQLSHDDDDQMRATYNAAQWLEPRRRMMQWWADEIDSRRRLGTLMG